MLQVLRDDLPFTLGSELRLRQMRTASGHSARNRRHAGIVTPRGHVARESAHSFTTRNAAALASSAPTWDESASTGSAGEAVSGASEVHSRCCSAASCDYVRPSNTRT